MDYRAYTKKAETHKAFNALKGIVLGIVADGLYNELEREWIRLWIADHKELANTNPFRDIILHVEMTARDDCFTIEEISDLTWLFDRFENEFFYYDRCTSDIQELYGVVSGIMADGVVHESELEALVKWLECHTHLETTYPYSMIMPMLVDERYDLIIPFVSQFVGDKIEEVSNSATSIFTTPELLFEGHRYVVSGRFQHYDRADVKRIIGDLGGVVTSAVSTKTSYVVVGTDGNPCWSYSTYGRKVEKALNFRADGHTVAIISEDHFCSQIIT